MELAELLKSLIALLFVIALIGVVAFVLKRYVLERNFLNLATTNAKKKRLKIVEQLILDSKRRIVIIEKDESEEITIILSATSETVVSVNPIKKAKK
jgi:flagellar protein FliO/FliZ